MQRIFSYLQITAARPKAPAAAFLVECRPFLYMDTPDRLHDVRSTRINTAEKMNLATVTLNNAHHLSECSSVSCQGLTSQIVTHSLVLGDVGYLPFRLPVTRFRFANMVFFIQLLNCHRNTVNGPPFLLPTRTTCGADIHCATHPTVCPKASFVPRYSHPLNQFSFHPLHPRLTPTSSVGSTG